MAWSEDEDENKDNPKNAYRFLIPRIFYSINVFRLKKYKKSCKFYANFYGKVDRGIHK